MIVSSVCRPTSNLFAATSPGTDATIRISAILVRVGLAGVAWNLHSRGHSASGTIK